jgi:hypothetical protein
VNQLCLAALCLNGRQRLAKPVCAQLSDGLLELGDAEGLGDVANHADVS